MTAGSSTKTWTIDPVHSDAEFQARHMMISKVRGSFSDFTGTIQLNPEHPEGGSVEAQINVASISTSQQQRDEHLRSADFFDVENHPQITFQSTKVVPKGENRFDVVGDLTIRGVTKEVTLDTTFLGRMPNDAFGKDRIALEATTTVNREEFGLTWNQALESGGVMVGKDITITLNIAATAEE